MKRQKIIKLFDKNGKEISNRMMHEGIVYKKIKSDNAEDIKAPDCDNCDRCHLDGEVINDRDCIYSFIEGTYGSCAGFIKEPYVLKKVRKKFKGI